MADIDLKRIHNLGMKAARVAADQMAEDLGKKFGLKGAWSGNTLSFERPGVTGMLAITDKDLHLTVSLGFLLKAMKGSLEGAVVRELDKLFEAPAPKPGAAKTPGKGARKEKKDPRKKGA
jgi:putative polyhydroxyalkanoate system protein